MMLNLFSIFDPSTTLFNLNWLAALLLIMLLPHIYWVYSSRLMNFLNKLFTMLTNEMNLILKDQFNYNNLIFLLTMFMFLLLNNLMGLFPYIFTSSSHLTFSMWISISLWLSFMIFGWLKNTTFMLIHLVPMGTPFFLMYFMVLIEMLSNIIRPLTLSVRLMANIVAGHLLLTLMGNFISNFLEFYFFTFIVQLMLMFLEFMVSMIQAYVFIILLTLYLKETN